MTLDQRTRRPPTPASPEFPELPAEQLTRRLDPATLGFDTTEEIEPLVGTIGQPRALDAIESGLAIGTAGFNLYLSGPAGSGRRTTVLDVIQAVAAERPAPDDWVYAHDFHNPDHPKALRLPAGRGEELSDALDEFIEANAASGRRSPRSSSGATRSTASWSTSPPSAAMR
jgi:hypothetical protein